MGKGMGTRWRRWGGGVMGGGYKGKGLTEIEETFKVTFA